MRLQRGVDEILQHGTALLISRSVCIECAVDANVDYSRVSLSKMTCLSELIKLDRKRLVDPSCDAGVHCSVSAG